MIWAYNNASWELKFHGGSNFGFFTITLDSSGGSGGNVDTKGLSFFAWHGIWLGVSWTLFGLLMIISQRYLKHLWLGK